MARGSAQSTGRHKSGGQPFSSASYSSGPAPKTSAALSNGKGKRKATDASRSDTDVGRPRKRRDVEDEQDVYVFADAGMKRSRSDAARLTLSHEESALAFGGKKGKDADSDDEGEDSDSAMASKIRKAAMRIAGEEAFDLADDESEVDSDEAWDDEGNDEDRWGDVFESLGEGSGKKKQKKREKETQADVTPAVTLNVDLSESEDDIPSGPSKVMKKSSTFRPNLSAFEGHNDDSDEEESQSGDSKEESLDSEGSINENDSEDNSDDLGDIPDPDLPSDLDTDSEADDDDDLLAFVSGLPGVSKRKAAQSDDDESENGKAVVNKKRRVLVSAKGPGGREDGGDYGLPSTDKLSLSSLIAAESSLKPAAAALLKSSLLPSSSKSVLKQGTLPAPLPTVVTDRLAREAAYEATKAEGDKWGGVMKRVKEAEYLKFPLQPGGMGAGPGASQGADRRRGGVKSAGEMIGSFQPSNDMESAVTALLNSANLKEAQLTQEEDNALAAQDLSVEDIAARRSELRHQRELMFRAEVKAKRVAKIKSKTFRKLARKRAEKAGGGAMDIEDLKRLDPERAEEELLKMETIRAKERATLKHSAKGGKWARNLHGQGDNDGQRKELEDMLQRKEQLKRKIKGLDSEDDDDSGSDEEEDSEEEDEGVIRGQAFDQLATIAKRNAGLEAESQQSGIMGMKFMQRAAAKSQRQADLEERELREQLEAYGEEGSQGDEDSEAEGGEGASYKPVGESSGRMVFAPTVPSRSIPQSGSSSQPKSSAVSFDSLVAPRKGVVEEEEEEENPWLANPAASSSRSRKKNLAIAGKNAESSDKAVQALKKQQRQKSSSARNGAMEDATVDIDVEAESLMAPKKGSKRLALEDESEDEYEESELVTKGPKAFQQRDLVAQAFAGDNVVEDFAAEKKRAVAADAPKEEDLTLPGWGNWGGKGVKKNKNARKFIQITPGIPASQRKDFERSNVIISEKKDKKATKYLSTDLPYPYTSAAQYEASFGTAVGSDWNTRTTHQRATMPRVTKKPGVIIDPISRLF